MKTIQFFRDRVPSFRFALSGVAGFFKHEPNARVHLVCTVVTIAAAFYFRVSASEAVELIIVTTLVWTAEIFNTSIEQAMDFISKERRKEIKLVKDLAACAVLVSAIGAFITGLFVFLPKMI